MTRDEILAILDRHWLTQQQAARLLGVGHSTFTAWLAAPGAPNHRPIPLPMAMLLRLYDEVPEARSWMLAEALERAQRQPPARA